MSGMVKAGLIGLAVGGILIIGVTLLLPLCTPCVAILAGLGAGFLACAWEKPASAENGAGLGAKAGAIAGVGSLIGQMVGALINGLVVGPERAVEVAQMLGLPAGQLTPRMYWASQIALNGVCGLINVVIGAGLGALGGFLWYQTMAQKPPQQELPA
jgi:hypothetical protein